MCQEPLVYIILKFARRFMHSKKFFCRLFMLCVAFFLFLFEINAQKNLFFEKDLTIEFNENKTQFKVPAERLWFIEKISITGQKSSLSIVADQEKIIPFENEYVGLVVLKKLSINNCSKCKVQVSLTQYLIKPIELELIDDTSTQY